MTYNLGATYILGAIYPYSELKNIKKNIFSGEKPKMSTIAWNTQKSGAYLIFLLYIVVRSDRNLG